ncbi:MAG: hypothetical protein ACLUHB_14990 [Odoribacter splanchnicus]
MEWLIVLMLILIGAILVVLEILVLPGINVAGILGFIVLLPEYISDTRIMAE